MQIFMLILCLLLMNANIFCGNGFGKGKKNKNTTVMLFKDEKFKKFTDDLTKLIKNNFLQGATSDEKTKMLLDLEHDTSELIINTNPYKNPNEKIELRETLTRTITDRPRVLNLEKLNQYREAFKTLLGSHQIQHDQYEEFGIYMINFFDNLRAEYKSSARRKTLETQFDSQREKRGAKNNKELQKIVAQMKRNSNQSAQ